MSTQRQANQRQHHGDLRALDHHESWRGVYSLLDVEPSIEPTNTDSGAATLSEGTESMSVSLSEKQTRDLASNDRTPPSVPAESGGRQ